jgi:hypothetical protein
MSANNGGALEGDGDLYLLDRLGHDILNVDDLVGLPYTLRSSNRL